MRVLVLELEDLAFDFDGVGLDVVLRKRVMTLRRSTEHRDADSADQPATRSVPNFYSPIRFRVERADIVFYDWGTFVQRWFGKFMTRFWNKSMKRRHFYESRLAYFYPADELHYVLTPVKSA